MRPAVDASAIVTLKSGELPAWKSTPPLVPDMVNVFEPKSNFPRVITTRWLVPERVTSVPSNTLPPVLSMVQLPVGGVPAELVNV